ncbi:HlyD family secretion protein [Roseivivax lentus]|uniref:HlyD family secretion protein n=1 Tax=Roseivivax lentus TaxID=633194 RepID=A0A1N7LPB9_9RHOB|nr:efflux RND transporter periplasmic adaptor subunit [Roseivivax lentus]SIS75703.1 HlyD family secretion protein [Roseivivax lentus]
MTDAEDDVAQTLGISGTGARRRRWRIGLAALAVILLGGLGAFVLTRGGPEVDYLTAPVARGDFDVIVSATGTVEPTNLVEISSELSGTLDKVHVDYNDTVEVGSVLATLDTTKLEAQLAVSRASLDAAIARVAMAQATLTEARDAFETAQSLEARGVTSHQTFVREQARFIRAQSELQSAQAEVALAEANLDLYQAEYDKACICSPVAGTVLNRAADPGQIVASALSAPILFTVAEDLRQMELRVDVDEADIGRVQVGQQAVFTVDAYDDRRFPAEIVTIRFAPETVDGVVTYKAVLTIDNADLALRPGMTATADIIVAEVRDALTVPDAALRYAPPDAEADAAQSKNRSGLLGMLIPEAEDGRTGRADGRTVWVLDADGPREVPVTPGLSDGRVTQILDGALSAGDRVITDRLDG